MCLNNLQIPNTTQTIIEQIIASPAALVALIAMIINLGISIANIIMSANNHKNESKYKTEIAFYQMTVLKSLEQLFVYISSVKKDYSELVSHYYVKTDSQECRTLVENCLKELDKLNEKTEAYVFPYYEGFSIELSAQLRKEFEIYYDEVTTVYSKYAQPQLGTTILARNQKSFGESTSKIISSMYELSKNYCPKLSTRN
jgi:hypothetical protein